MIAAATDAIACRPELHCLLTVWIGTVSGIPESRAAMRHWMARCDESPSTEPMTMSPMSLGSTPVRCSVASKTAERRSSGEVSFRPPRLACLFGWWGRREVVEEVVVGEGEGRGRGQTNSLFKTPPSSNFLTLVMGVLSADTITTSSSVELRRA